MRSVEVHSLTLLAALGEDVTSIRCRCISLTLVSCDLIHFDERDAAAAVSATHLNRVWDWTQAQKNGAIRARGAQREGADARGGGNERLAMSGGLPADILRCDGSIAKHHLELRPFEET